MKAAVISRRLPVEARKSLENDGFELIEIPPASCVDKRISDHPDLQVFILNGTAYLHPMIDKMFGEEVTWYCKTVVCAKALSPEYPLDCSYNIACTGKYALFKKGTLPNEIERSLDCLKIVKIHVSQGYARCSTVIADENSIITEDENIYRSAVRAGMNALKIGPGHIPLEGFGRGFVGGATGLYKNTLYLSGALPDLPCFADMINFLLSRNIHVRELSSRPAEDFGSIFFIDA